MVMAIAFAICGNMHELGALAPRGKTGEETLRKSVAIVEEPFEGNRVADGTIVEKQ
jgi:ribosomal protein L7Ae-like RNA K-turn-binding protein